MLTVTFVFCRGVLEIGGRGGLGGNVAHLFVEYRPLLKTARFSVPFLMKPPYTCQPRWRTRKAYSWREIKTRERGKAQTQIDGAGGGLGVAAACSLWGTRQADPNAHAHMRVCLRAVLVGEGSARPLACGAAARCGRDDGEDCGRREARGRRQSGRTGAPPSRLSLPRQLPRRHCRRAFTRALPPMIDADRLPGVRLSDGRGLCAHV